MFVFIVESNISTIPSHVEVGLQIFTGITCPYRLESPSEEDWHRWDELKLEHKVGGRSFFQTLGYADVRYNSFNLPKNYTENQIMALIELDKLGYFKSQKTDSETLEVLRSLGIFESMVHWS